MALTLPESPSRLAACALALASFLALGGTAQAAGDPAAGETDKAAPTRIDKVKKTTVRWHLAPASQPNAEATAALVERFRQLTEARFTGETDKISPAPEAEIQKLDDGTVYGRVPAEHIHTMFLTLGENGLRLEQCAEAGAIDKALAKPAPAVEDN